MKTASGTANLVMNGETIPVRIELDPSNNTILCSYPSNSFAGQKGILDKPLTLTEVKFVGDGVIWSTPKIEKLMLLESRGNGWGVSESEIGEITCQNKHRANLKVSKNGQHVFELNKKFDRSFEFAGGIQTAQQIEIADGIMFFSDGEKSNLFGSNCSELEVKDEIVALSLACGCMMMSRFEVNERKLTMTFWQSLQKRKTQTIYDDSSEGFIDSTKRTMYFADVYNKAKASLETIPDGAIIPIKKLIPFFLYCRTMTNVLDYQMVSLFTFFEAIDGTKTLSGNTLASLLGVDINTAKALVKVRNEVSHGKKSLSEAIKEHVNLNSDDYKPFIVKRFDDIISEATFMNFLHSKANQCFLKLIDCDLPPAKPYPTN